MAAAVVIVEPHTTDEVQPLSSKANTSYKPTTLAADPYDSPELSDDEKRPLQASTRDSFNHDALGSVDHFMERAHSDPLAINSNNISNKPRYSINNSTNTSMDLVPALSNHPSSAGEAGEDPGTHRGSVFVDSKPYHSHDDILNTNQAVSVRSIAHFSIETIPAFSQNRTQSKLDSQEEVVVPARANLVNVPFFSVPLTLEATTNAFFDFRERLNEMGFVEQAEAALICTECESIENAVAFILSNWDAVYHRFRDAHHEVELSEAVCEVCGMFRSDHLIDERGTKIGSPGVGRDELSESAEEMEESVKIEIIDSEEMVVPSVKRILEMIAKSEQELEPAPVFTGATENCLICFEAKPLDYFSKTECGHDYYCKDCLTQHYKVKTTDGDVLKVKCIDIKCQREIKEEEILAFLTDTELRAKFLKFKRQKLLMLNENARFCPTADCEGYMIGSRFKPKLTCPECSTQVCFNCSKLWHGYLKKCSSAQNAANLDLNDAKFLQWESGKREDVKRCPKCKVRIEKNEGCNHMTCSSCHYEFCWICRGKYAGNHFSEWNVFGCPGGQYNRGNLCTIQRCPSCFPMWFRRFLLVLALILLLPLILVFGILAGCVYGCAICVMFLFEHACCCCR